MSFISNVTALLIALTLFALFRTDHSAHATSTYETLVPGSLAIIMSFAAHLIFTGMGILAVVLIYKIPIRRVPVAPTPAPMPQRKVYFEKNTLPPIVGPTYPSSNVTMQSPKTPELPVSSAADDAMDWEPTVTTSLVEIPEFPVSSPSIKLSPSGASLEALRSRLDHSVVPFATGAFGCSSSHQRRKKAEAARAAKAALQPKTYSRFLTRWCHPDLYKLEASKDRPTPLKSALKVASSDLPKKVHWQNSGMTISEVRMIGTYQASINGRPINLPLDHVADRHGLVRREWKTDAKGFISELHRTDEICLPPSSVGLYGTDQSRLVANSPWAGLAAFCMDRSDTNAILARAEQEEQAEAAVFAGRSGGPISYFT